MSLGVARTGIEEAECILAVKITQNHKKKKKKGLLGLFQTAYIEKILEKLRLAQSALVEISIDKGGKQNLVCSNGYRNKETAYVSYASAVGCLMYS